MSIWHWTKLPKGDHRFWEKKDGWYGLKYKEKWIIDYCEKGDPYVDDISHYAGPIPQPKKKPTVSKETCQKIIDHLNKRLEKRPGKGYKVTGSVMADIQARFNEGFTEQDFYKAINNQLKEWGMDPRWRKYIRPSTLFKTKFQEYLQNGTSSPPKKQKPTNPNFILDDAYWHLVKFGRGALLSYAKKHNMTPDDIAGVEGKYERDQQGVSIDQIVGRIG